MLAIRVLFIQFCKGQAPVFLAGNNSARALSLPWQLASCLIEFGFIGDVRCLCIRKKILNINAYLRITTSGG